MEETFIRLVQENEGILQKITLLYADGTEERQDLRQEILFQSWKSFSKFSHASKFSTWFYRVGLNTALTYRRKANDNKGLIRELESHHQTELVTHETGNELLYLIIKQLKEVDKMLITLHLEGYKNPEISSITGMTVNHVNVKIHRLKEKIIDQYKKVSNGSI